MRRILITASAMLLLAAAVWAPTAAPQRSVGAATRNCGSFKYGTDGRKPGPGHITATNTTCWMARATALLGPAPGWHCANTVGILFVCKRGSAVVKFYGE